MCARLTAESVAIRLRRIVSQVFQVPPETIDDDSGPDTIESWDSIAQLNLTLALEGEFGITMSPEEVMDLLSVGIIRSTLASHGVEEEPAA